MMMMMITMSMLLEREWHKFSRYLNCWSEPPHLNPPQIFPLPSFHSSAFCLKPALSFWVFGWVAPLLLFCLYWLGCILHSSGNTHLERLSKSKWQAIVHWNIFTGGFVATTVNNLEKPAMKIQSVVPGKCYAHASNVPIHHAWKVFVWIFY